MTCFSRSIRNVISIPFAGIVVTRYRFTSHKRSQKHSIRRCKISGSIAYTDVAPWHVECSRWHCARITKQSSAWHRAHGQPNDRSYTATPCAEQKLSRNNVTAVWSFANRIMLSRRPINGTFSAIVSLHSITAVLQYLPQKGKQLTNERWKKKKRRRRGGWKRKEEK